MRACGASDQAGNTSYAAATPAQQTINVGKKSTTLTLAATPNPVVAGGSVTITATLTSDPPTGTVAFLDNSVTIAGCAAAPLDASATSAAATCTMTPPSGAHTITATYSGDAVFLQVASSVPLVLTTVNPAVPAPLLDRWTMLLLAGLIGAGAFWRWHRAGRSAS